jgi:hypothetical protein
MGIPRLVIEDGEGFPVCMLSLKQAVLCLKSVAQIGVGEGFFMFIIV